MNDTTWVKLYRKSLYNDVRRNDPTAWRVFETLLLIVDSRTGKWSGGRYQLEAADGALNSSTIYKALKRLEKQEMISINSNTRFTEISICKYSEYARAGNTPGNTSSNTPGNTSSNTLTRSKEVRSKNSNTSSSDELNRAHEWICSLFGKNTNRFKLTTQRKQKLRLRMNELGRERLKNAFEAVAASNFHRGDNDRGWKIDDDPYWLLTSAEKAEKWANKYEEKPIEQSINLAEVEIKL